MMRQKWHGLVFFLATIFLGNAAAVEPAWKLEQWPEARQLVWARPGESGSVSDASKWLEQGQPAKSGPDRETDIILPAAQRHYRVGGGRRDQVRHVVIEENAELNGGHRNELEIWGNVDVKSGGDIHFISIRGDRDTYFHIENAVFPGNGRIYRHVGNIPKERACNSHISHKFQVCKIGTKSVEFMGNAGVSDEVMVQHGKVIISGDFRYSGATNKGAFEIFDGGILEIQSGGRLAPFNSANAKNVYNVNVYRNGIIQAGSPERPLTSDAYLCLGFTENSGAGRSGLYAALGSSIRVYSADPKRARLVITSNTSVPGFVNGNGQPIGRPEERASGNKGIALQLAGDVQLNGVHFDYLMEGGIALLNPEVVKTWRNITFGDKCAAPQGKLFAKMQADPNSYYHARGDMKSEYALTVTAVREMQQHLNKYDPFQLKTTPENTQERNIGQGISTPTAMLFKEPIDVEIITKVPGARIRYTTDGSEPNEKSPVYEGAIRISQTTRLTIKAFKQGVGFSPTYTTVYVFQ